MLSVCMKTVLLSLCVFCVQAAAVTLTVTVEDYNDIPPVFSSSTYSFSIDESTTGPAMDTDVFTGVSSTDEDFTTENRNVRYELEFPRISSTLGWLDIDNMVCYSIARFVTLRYH